MITEKTWLRTGLVALAAITMSAGTMWAQFASATHVRVEGSASAEQLVSPGLTVVTPPSLQAEEITAHEVRAQVIYANKIEADEIRGTIHQTKGVKISDARGELKAPQVMASVIYADEIKANTVVANDIYVRELRWK